MQVQHGELLLHAFHVQRSPIQGGLCCDLRYTSKAKDSMPLLALLLPAFSPTNSTCHIQEGVSNRWIKTSYQLPSPYPDHPTVLRFLRAICLLYCALLHNASSTCSCSQEIGRQIRLLIVCSWLIVPHWNRFSGKKASPPTIHFHHKYLVSCPTGISFPSSFVKQICPKKIKLKKKNAQTPLSMMP